MSPETDFETVVDMHYSSLYRFAFSLTHRESDACDLTQQTFYIWAAKGHQLRNSARVKSWLFTTLYREHLRKERRSTRFPEAELGECEHELPVSLPALETLDSAAARLALQRLAQPFQAPVALFYLEDYSYQDIAEILGIPVGTVKSRISRGIHQMQQRMLSTAPAKTRREGV